jgi:hypothetical protein
MRRWRAVATIVSSESAQVTMRPVRSPNMTFEPLLRVVRSLAYIFADWAVLFEGSDCA